MNESLTKPYTKEEINRALRQMHPSKAPGPDGMNPNFYQKFWHVVSHDTINTVIDFLNGTIDHAPLNETHIVLIPKVLNPESPKDYRPISLCNVVVRIATKVLANRLKDILPFIVSINQSAFIPGRMITDNAMTAFELFHSMKKKTKGRNGILALKLDMSKAYDRVEWPFLKAVLTKLGFCDMWINTVMNCVSSVSYSIIINGEPTNRFFPERGLRQGDPLSPYLFILCAETLSTLLYQAEARNQIHGFRVARSAPPVSHLFFADDSILFCRASEREALALKNILRIYEEASGQKINLDKSELTVSKNIEDQRKNKIREILGVNDVPFHKKYLGLPTVIGKSKKQVFGMLLERVHKKLKNWKENTLSWAGKEILLKSIIQAIPTYTMSCFLLPTSICDEIEQAIAHFFWGGVREKHKIHWNAWSCLTTSKFEGGLGFRDLHRFNLAMLGKQLWRILQKPDSLISQLLKAKYFPRRDVLSAPIGHQPSYLWRSLIASRELVSEGMAWRIGNGRKVPIIGAKWISGLPPTAPKTFQDLETSFSLVSDLIDQQIMIWKENVVYQLFCKEEADRICAMPLSTRLLDDKRIWGYDKKGLYSVRTAYHLTGTLLDKSHEYRASSSQTEKGWKRLWHSKVTPRIRHFLWRACVNSLPTKDNLSRRGIDAGSVCEICGLSYESSDHLLLQCIEVAKIWRYGPLRLESQFLNNFSFKQVVWSLLEKLPQKAFTLFACIAWNIWKRRNEFYFEKKSFHWKEILLRAHKSWMEMCDTFERDTENRAEHQRLQRWKPPPTGTFVMNSDINILHDGQVGLGVVFRDEKGMVIFACKTEVKAAGSTTLMEGIAVRYGLNMALLQNISNLYVQSDNQNLIRGLHGDVELDPYSEVIKDDILAVARRVHVIEFNFIPRDCNRVAHLLSRCPNFVGVNFIPKNILTIVSEETS